MSSRPRCRRIEDMLASIAYIREFAAGMTEESFTADRKTVYAVLCGIGVIGEAARHVPDELQTRYPSVSWPEIQGMRNVIFHEYFRVHLAIIWQTVTEDTPALESRLREILEREP